MSTSTKATTSKPAVKKNKTGSAGISLSVIAKDAGVPERKARRVARKLGLGTGKGKRYGFTKSQATKLNKALTA